MVLFISKVHERKTMTIIWQKKPFTFTNKCQTLSLLTIRITWTKKIWIFQLDSKNNILLMLLKPDVENSVILSQPNIMLKCLQCLHHIAVISKVPSVVNMSSGTSLLLRKYFYSNHSAKDQQVFWTNHISLSEWTSQGFP